MPTVVTKAPSRPVPPDPPRKRWTRAECAALEASGLLDVQHIELIEGDLISKMGKKRCGRGNFAAGLVDSGSASGL